MALFQLQAPPDDRLRRQLIAQQLIGQGLSQYAGLSERNAELERERSVNEMLADVVSGKPMQPNRLDTGGQPANAPSLMPNSVNDPGAMPVIPGTPAVPGAIPGMTREQALSIMAVPGGREGLAAQLLKGLEPGAGFTLGEGDTRFDAQGNPIAEGAPKKSNHAQAMIDMNMDPLNPADVERYFGLLRQPAASANVYLPPLETEQQKRMGQSFGTRLGETLPAQRTALRKSLSNIGMIERTLETQDLSTGPGAGLKQWFKNATGFDFGGTSNLELLQSALQSEVEQNLALRSGPQTDQDEARVARITGSIQDSKEGLKALAKLSKARAQRNLEELEFERETLETQGRYPTTEDYAQRFPTPWSDGIEVPGTQAQPAGQVGGLEAFGVPAANQRVPGQRYRVGSRDLLWDGQLWQE